MSLCGLATASALTRRDCCALGLWPASGPLLAQPPPRSARVAFLLGPTPSPSMSRNIVDPFVQGLGEAGFVEGRNLAIDTRWAEGQPERLPGLLAELLAQRPHLILAVGPAPVMAAKAGTKANCPSSRQPSCSWCST